MKNVKTLWLIPARGGSKGIPGKNIKPFLGRPLVCRAVDQALECAAVGDVVFVSTDSEEIAKAAYIFPVIHMQPCNRIFHPNMVFIIRFL